MLSDEEKQKCVDLVEKLASWSRTYPRNRIYSANQQVEIDGVLIAIEEEAKSIFK